MRAEVGRLRFHVFMIWEEIVSGTMLGFQIVAAGPLTDVSEPGHPEHANPTHNAAEARQALDSLKVHASGFRNGI